MSYVLAYRLYLSFCQISIYFNIVMYPSGTALIYIFERRQKNAVKL